MASVQSGEKCAQEKFANEKVFVSPVASTGPLLSETFEYTEEEIANYVIDPEISRNITRKYDQRVIPMVFFMYLFSALDRGNLSNAKTDTLEKDLALTGNQYNSVLTTMTVMFASCAVLGGFLTRRFGPTRMLPIYMLGWGSMALINVAARNFGGIIAIRFFLGMFEGFFGPSVTIYLTSFYTRGELGKRMAAWYSSAAISGAFAGLLAYGVFHADSVLSGWKILFISKSHPTLSDAAVVLPNYPQDAAFLTPLEKEVAVIRLLKDASKKVNGAFSYAEFFAPLREWKFYVFAVFAVCYGTASSTATTFMPQIIGRFALGKVKTNIYTVAPYCAATLYLWANAWASDRLRQRSVFLIGAMTLTTIGCIILVALPVTAIGPGYFACFLITMGAFVPTALFHSWHNNNDPSENGRAFRTGFLTFAANAGGLISANIFLNSDAPKYTHALIISACLQVAGISIALGMRTHMVLDNRRRNREQGVNWRTKDVPTADLMDGPKNPAFRHFL
ncbi:major facilitator superfamily domain-containing protein [Mycena rosella]|uniref:Major facilitator superfamily domain-containing protein n=1 Tax=Mycena rosella TaxID=1033263 RepID=A0AAD7CWH7_MYCRO|nr:major facilitator superfamily domain-containing protein [Mycena rosella]